MMTLLCEEIIVGKIQRSENWMANLAESSKEGYGSKGLFASDDEDDDWSVSYRRIRSKLQNYIHGES
jgi:hypothetical protein